MTVIRRITSRGIMLQLPFDIRQHAADAKPEELCLAPRIAEVLLHQGEPLKRLLRRANATRWLETHGPFGVLRVLANSARHDQADWQGRVRCFLARGCLDEVRSGHHGHHAGACDVAQRQQITGAKNYFQMRGPASVLERGDFVVKRLPFRAKDVCAGDDHIDFIGASFHGAPNFRDAFLEGGKTRRESRRDRCNMNAAALDSAPRGFHEGVINADGSDLDVKALDAKPLNEFALDRLSRLGAQSANTLVSVVAGERRQIHAGDSAQKPCGLPFLLYGSPSADGLCAALDRAGVHAHCIYPIQIQWNAAVWLELAPCAVGDGSIGRRKRASKSLAI